MAEEQYYPNKKVTRVIGDCKTMQQLMVATKYLALAYDAGIVSFQERLFWIGVINGMAFANGWATVAFQPKGV